jgi:hypothetical protein
MSRVCPSRLLCALFLALLACGDDSTSPNDAGPSSRAGAGGAAGTAGEHAAHGGAGGGGGAGTGATDPDCLHRSLTDCEIGSSCRLYKANGCTAGITTVFCGANGMFCPTAIFCARDPNGQYWTFPSLCGRSEVQSMGWQIAPNTACGNDICEYDGGLDERDI